MVGLVSVGCCYMKLTGSGGEGEEEGEESRKGGGGEEQRRGGEGGKEGGEGEEGREDETKGVEGEGGRVKEEGSEGVEEGEEGDAVEGSEGMEGYPMSQFLRRQCVYRLSYAAKELACHSLATYSDRLIGEIMLGCNHICIIIPPPPGDFEHLKVHCHRAAVETVLRKVCESCDRSWVM